MLGGVEWLSVSQSALPGHPEWACVGRAGRRAIGSRVCGRKGNGVISGSSLKEYPCEGDVGGSDHSVVPLSL